jgi:hypothetical protein
MEKVMRLLAANSEMGAHQRLARIRYPNNDPREILLDAPLIARASTAVADISRQLA